MRRSRQTLLLALVIAAAFAAIPAASADDADGRRPSPGHDLQELVDRTAPGGRVVIPAGTYHGPVVITTPVVLEPRGEVELVGDGTGTVLTIAAPGTIVRDLTVRGSGPGPTGNPAGVLVTADDVTVERLTVEDCYRGIAVEEAADVRLVDNRIIGRAGARIVDEGHAVEHGTQDDRTHATPDDEDAHGHAHPPTDHRARGDGIWLHDVDHVLVRGNDIRSTRDGVYVSFGSYALIDGNVIRHSRYAVHSMYASDLTLVENRFTDNLSGAVLMYRGPTLVLRNHIEGSDSTSTGFALLLKDVVGAEVVQNTFVDNRVGIHVDGPVGGEDPSRFTANTVASNAIGVAAYSSAHGVFRANSFVDNHIQVLPQGGPLHGLTWWDRGFGNLWSTYRGYEGIAAGRGAVPHAEGGAVDRLLGRNPELLALAETPALRLLRSVEERWGRRDPVLVDPFPITSPLSPPVPTNASASTLAPLTAGVLGGLLVLPWLVMVVRGRHRRRPILRRTRYVTG